MRTARTLPSGPLVASAARAKLKKRMPLRVSQAKEMQAKTPRHVEKFVASNHALRPSTCAGKRHICQLNFGKLPRLSKLELMCAFRTQQFSELQSLARPTPRPENLPSTDYVAAEPLRPVSGQDR